MSGLFACHHGFDLTAHELSASILAVSTLGASDEIRTTNNNSSTAIGGMGPQYNTSPAILLKPEQLKLPTPIIVMGLMKAGTTSIYGYFKCGLDPKFSRLSHYNCNYAGKNVMSCGKRMRRNITKMKTKAFDTMDMFTVYAELDGQEKNGGITVPQWQFVNEIHEHFPEATWILNLRDPHDWLKSIDHWQDLRQRFIDNPFLPDLPRGKGGNDQDMIAFYLEQAQRIRKFVEENPSHTLVEVPIDKPEAGKIMEDAFGISSEACWRKRNVNDGSAVWVEH
ncbi:unnamed protein product [Cylindrotheca closterium]|uniref:Sulfotransferase domain-containing protein n=1 Tax=Cylindrotheca closterium TaxID=2856 RepID=A0AAD2JHN8_9STRA|nr:unnamed protein product [Cylindrotheca closterium]